MGTAKTPAGRRTRDAGSYFCKLLPRRPLGNCGALETRWGGQQATSAENAVNVVGGVRGWGGAVGNCLSQKCERANRWGRLKVTAAEIKGGRVRGLKAGGAGVSWEVTFAKIGRRRAFGTLTGGREVTFKGTASGGGAKTRAGGLAKNYSQENRDGGRGRQRNGKSFPQHVPPARIAEALRQLSTLGPSICPTPRPRGPAGGGCQE